MIDQTMTVGDLIQIIALIGLIFGYFKGYHKRQNKLDVLLAKQDVRIDKAEEDIDQNCSDIRNLYDRKVDKK